MKIPSISRLLSLLAAAALLTACQTPQPVAYSGKGGMTAYKISPQVYTWHYENGFTGPDAMGWDPNLQLAWSRLAAARTCGVSFAQDKVVAALIKTYGHDKLAHEMVGIDFHHAQSKGAPGFCTPARISELQVLVPAMEAGQFPRRH